MNFREFSPSDWEKYPNARTDRKGDGPAIVTAKVARHENLFAEIVVDDDYIAVYVLDGERNIKVAMALDSDFDNGVALVKMAFQEPIDIRKLVCKFPFEAIDGDPEWVDEEMKD